MLGNISLWAVVLLLYDAQPVADIGAIWKFMREITSFYQFLLGNRSRFEQLLVWLRFIGFEQFNMEIWLKMNKTRFVFIPNLADGAKLSFLKRSFFKGGGKSKKLGIFFHRFLG